MSFELDHIGIATSSLQKSATSLAAIARLGMSRIETLGSQGVNAAFLRLESNPQAAKLELIEATDESSGVARFIDRFGPGLHHLAWRVQNLESAVNWLSALGFEVVGEPQQGVEGNRIVFIHPRSTGGYLLELVERE